MFNKINKEGLSDVVLVKNEYRTINAPDVNAAIIPKESTLRLVPNHGPNNVLGWIKSVSNFFKEDKAHKDICRKTHLSHLGKT